MPRRTRSTLHRANLSPVRSPVRSQRRLNSSSMSALGIGLDEDEDHFLVEHEQNTPAEEEIVSGPSALSQRLSALLMDPTLSDVVFVCQDDVELRAHRCILAAWSDVFRRMFCSQFKEGHQNVVTVKLPNVEASAVQLLLKYLYSGEAHLTAESSLSVLSLANMYQIESLKVLCKSFFSSHLNVMNACVFFGAADHFDVPDLRQQCLTFIEKHFEAIVTTEAWCSLPLACLLDIASSDMLVCKSEESVYHAAAIWLDHDQERFGVLDQLLPHIRFPLMSPPTLLHMVESNERLMHSPLMRDLLYEAYRYHALGCQLATLQRNALGNTSRRMQERGQEVLIFGAGGGIIQSSTPSLSVQHPVKVLRVRDDRYWIPKEEEHAEVVVRLESLYRLCAIKLQNRHSREFEVFARAKVSDNWQQIVPLHSSGPQRHVTEVRLDGGALTETPSTPSQSPLTVVNGSTSGSAQSMPVKRNAVVAKYVKLVIHGRTHPSYHASIYWFEITGRRHASD
ncbi:MAG: hypothetical protein MHM6MM_009697 [Cercozoa sp. M6MM]